MEIAMLVNLKGYFILTAMSVLVLVDTALAQQPRANQKQDIRSFYVGMTLTDFQQQLKGIGCEVASEEFRISSKVYCKVKDGSFTFRFTKNLAANLLAEVGFTL